MSLLVYYENHVAMQLWNGVVSKLFDLIFGFSLSYDLRLYVLV